MSSDPVLSLEGLRCGFQAESGYLRVVDGVSFELRNGETLGIVGESGCGKTVTAMSIMGLLPQPAGVIESGKLMFAGNDLFAGGAAAMRSIRGRRIAMIFQEPMTALNPVHRVGRQLVESLALYEPALGREQHERQAVELLKQVGIPAPEQRLHEYPHQLSGGMRQRVMIAMALAGEPEVLIADEPTTALDVTVQAQILDLIKTLQARHGMAVIFITHDLGVVAEICERVLVMYAGRIAERATVNELFSGPRHPYTQGLIRSIPTPETPAKTRLQVIEGIVPALDRMPSGCRFSNRCEFADDLCRNEVPMLEAVADEHEAACHHWREVSL